MKFSFDAAFEALKMKLSSDLEIEKLATLEQI